MGEKIVIIAQTGTQPIITPRLAVGPQGIPGPELKIQYSTDNSTWHDTFQAGDIYMRISTDGGSTWTQGYKFIGDDGQDAPNVLMQFSPDNANWHTDYQQGDAYVRFSNDNGVTWTNGVPVAVNADTVDGYHASDFQVMIDQKVDEFIVPRSSSQVVWYKIGELDTDIGSGENNLILLVSGVGSLGNNKPGVDIVQVSTRGSVSVDVYSLVAPGVRRQTYCYRNKATTGKTEIWVKRDAYTYETHFAVLNVRNATYGNLQESTGEPGNLVYVDIKTHWTSGNDGSGSGLDADTLDGKHLSEIGGGMKYQIFTASGTFTVPSGVTNVKVTLIGGGGGGGGSDNVNYGGGGGGGGVYYRQSVNVTPGSNISVTIGSGGSGGGNNQNGSSGGTSSFGSYLSSTGGAGGKCNNGSAGAAGSPSTSYFTQAGGTSWSTMGHGGAGGSTVLGIGGKGTAGNAQTGVGFGAGGAGAKYGSYGGNGSPGVCIVEWEE